MLCAPVGRIVATQKTGDGNEQRNSMAVMVFYIGELDNDRNGRRLFHRTNTDSAHR
jgi:hypothetical protein